MTTEKKPYKPNVTLIGTEEENAHLPMSEQMQYAFVGHMESDSTFFFLVVNKVQESWFINSFNAMAFGLMKKFYLTNKRYPSPGKLESGVEYPPEIECTHEWNKIEPRDQYNIQAAFVKAREARQIVGQDIIKAELEAWLQTREYHMLTRDSSALFNQGKFKESYAIVRERLNAIEQASFDSTKEYPLWDYDYIMDEMERSYHGALYFGISLMDSCLLDNNDGNGGLLKGDTTVILAPVNQGKTTCLITIAARNMWEGKHVLYISHEGTDTDISAKLWCSMLGVTKDEWRAMRKDPMTKAFLDVVGEKVKKRFTYYPMNKSGGTIEETVAAIRMLNDRHMAETGFGYDLYLDDYPGVLHTERASKGKLTERANLDIVYGDLVDLAGELRLHCVCAIQSNREGSKINRKISENDKGQRQRLLSMEDASEAFGPMMRATNVITLNRSPENAAQNIVVYNLCKSRSSKTGMVVMAESRYERYRTHWPYGQDNADDYGDGVVYQGTHTYADKARAVLERNRGKQVSEMDFQTETKSLGESIGEAIDNGTARVKVMT